MKKKSAVNLDVITNQLPVSNELLGLKHLRKKELVKSELGLSTNADVNITQLQLLPIMVGVVVTIVVVSQKMTNISKAAKLNQMVSYPFAVNITDP
jgi:hypothetical protein